MVLPLVAPIVGGAWLGQAVFGGDDMSQVQKILPIYLAVQEGSPRPLHDASMIASDHGRKQAGFADNADKLASLLSTAWEGDAAEAATKKVTKLSKSARETGTALDTNGKNFESQALAFNDIQGQMKPMDNPAPEGSGFLDRLAPWDTGAEEAVERNQEAAKHNTGLYDQYGKTTKSNAETISDKYGNTGNAGQPVDPGTREPGDPNDPAKREEEARRRQQEAEKRAEEQRKKMEAEAAKRQAEAQKKAEEQRKKMEEEAKRRQEEAQKKAEEQKRKMEQEAKQREEEAKRRAEEQRKKMEQEARQRQEEAQRRAEEQRRRMQQDAEERARQAREQMKLSGGKFNPSGTSASSFSPSDFAGAGAGSGAGGLGASGAGAGADGGAAAGAGKASGAMGPGAGAAGAGAGAGGARGGAGGMRGGGMGGGMMGGGAGGGGKGGEDKEHKRKVMATENPNDLFGTDEKAVPPVIGEK